MVTGMRFGDPDEVIYRSYNVMQDGQEAYVDGLLDEHDELEYDSGLSAEWLGMLATLYAPGRYLLHTVQMVSAYLFSMAPASTISNCVGFQMADALRWVSRTSYRTRELANHHPGKGFGESERALWEKEAAWQGFRELMERLLVVYEWGETLIGLNVIARPAIDEAFLRQFAYTARRHGDSLFGLLADAQLRDSDRSRRWTTAFVQFVRDQDGNAALIEQWMAKWVPLGDQAIEAFCAALPDSPSAGSEAKKACKDFRQSLGLAG